MLLLGHTMELFVNGLSYRIAVDPEKPLLWVLREELALNGTKYGCGIGVCGSCMILLDRVATPSCRVAVGSLAKTSLEIITIEGLNDRLGKIIKESWLEERVSQCGYCQPGQIISAYALLARKPNPSDREIEDSMRNLCRCGSYQRIRAAIKRASKTIMNGQKKDQPRF